MSPVVPKRPSAPLEGGDPGHHVDAGLGGADVDLHLHRYVRLGRADVDHAGTGLGQVRQRRAQHVEVPVRSMSTTERRRLGEIATAGQGSCRLHPRPGRDGAERLLRLGQRRLDRRLLAHVRGEPLRLGARPGRTERRADPDLTPRDVRDPPLRVLVPPRPGRGRTLHAPQTGGGPGSPSPRSRVQ